MNAMMYFLTDTVGLLLVRSLPINTKMHHIATNLLGIYVVFTHHSSVCGSYIPVLYACFSSLSFIVNFYLAFRAQYPESNKRTILSRISYWIYAVTSVVNWIVQIIYIPVVIFYGEFLFPLLYTGLLYFIIKDDIILMSWLKKDFEKRSVPVVPAQPTTQPTVTPVLDTIPESPIESEPVEQTGTESTDDNDSNDNNDNKKTA
jgi:hypothetical protein